MKINRSAENALGPQALCRYAESMKTLIVKYLPSGAASHTQKLLTKFTDAIGDRTIETGEKIAAFVMQWYGEN